MHRQGIGRASLPSPGAGKAAAQVPRDCCCVHRKASDSFQPALLPGMLALRQPGTRFHPLGPPCPGSELVWCCVNERIPRRGGGSGGAVCGQVVNRLLGDTGTPLGLPSAWYGLSLALMMSPLGFAHLLFLHPLDKGKQGEMACLNVALKPIAESF